MRVSERPRSEIGSCHHWDVRLDHLALDGVVDPRPVDRRDRRAGPDRVDADALAGVLEGEGAGEVLAEGKYSKFLIAKLVEKG